jgi:hypothetical protein
MESDGQPTSFHTIRFNSSAPPPRYCASIHELGRDSDIPPSHK